MTRVGILVGEILNVWYVGKKKCYQHISFIDKIFPVLLFDPSQWRQKYHHQKSYESFKMDRQIQYDSPENRWQVAGINQHKISSHRLLVR